MHIFEKFSLRIPGETSISYNLTTFLTQKPFLEPWRRNWHSKWTGDYNLSSQSLPRGIFSQKSCRTTLFCYFPKLGTQLHFAINASSIHFWDFLFLSLEALGSERELETPLLYPSDVQVSKRNWKYQPLDISVRYQIIKFRLKHWPIGK